MIQRVDFVIKDTHGECASYIRVYINHKQAKGLKCLDVSDGYDITYRKGSFYYMYTIYVDECDIEIKDSAIKISRSSKEVKE